MTLPRGDFTAWYLSAERLRDAANLVLAGIPEKDRGPTERPPEFKDFVTVNAQPDLRGVYLYLGFLALENLLKGIWYEEHKKALCVSPPKALSEHRLLPLCALLSVSLSDREREFVELARSVDFIGRYPSPIKNQGDELTLPDSLDLTASVAVFERLYDQLVTRLMKDVDDSDF